MIYHNISFCGEIRKPLILSFEKGILFGAMEEAMLGENLPHNKDAFVITEQCRSTAKFQVMKYEGMSISNQPIPFPIDRETQDFHALFQYMF